MYVCLSELLLVLSAAIKSGAGDSFPPALLQSNSAACLQQQNSNLTQELPQLLDDVDAQLDFAAAAFGAAPDAVNLWIGDERASTTFHKDHVSHYPNGTPGNQHCSKHAMCIVQSTHELTWVSLGVLCCWLLMQYENLYAVVRGTKIFHLLPPTELYRMGLKQYPAAHYQAQV